MLQPRERHEVLYLRSEKLFIFLVLDNICTLTKETASVRQTVKRKRNLFLSDMGSSLLPRPSATYTHLLEK